MVIEAFNHLAFFIYIFLQLIYVSNEMLLYIFLFRRSLEIFLNILSLKIVSTDTSKLPTS